MKRIRLAIFVLCLAASSLRAPAAMQVILHNGLALNWSFRADPVSRDFNLSSLGYYRDYNGDGLPDYLMAIHDLPTTGALRLFCLDTSTATLQKAYPTDVTAGRDFLPDSGAFLPTGVFLPRARGAASPDLAVLGTNADLATTGTYTELILQRLDPTTTGFLTRSTQVLPVVSADLPKFLWPEFSFNDDNYPDFLLYNARPNAAGQFVVTCYDGSTSAVIWSQTIAKDSLDTTDSLLSGESLLSVQAVRSDGRGNTGDYDGDHRPDLLLYYTFYNQTGGPGVYTTYLNLAVLSGATASS